MLADRGKDFALSLPQVRAEHYSREQSGIAEQ
jgi:hypothetical protein